MQAPMTQRPDSILSGIFSWQMAVALVGGVAFWLSIEMPSVLMHDDRTSTTVAYLCSADVLEKIKRAKPMQLLRKGQKDQAVDEAQKALKEHPYDVPTLMIAGNVDIGAGKNEEGAALLRKCTFLCPQSRYVRLNYARGLANAGMGVEAANTYDQLAQAFPNEWVTPRLELAELLLKGNRPSEAVDRLKEVVAADNKNGYARRKLGVAMAAVGDSKQGFEEFIKGCALESEQGPPPDLQTFIDKIGNHNKAEEALRTEIAKNPGDTGNVILLAELLVNADRIKEAKAVIFQPLQDPQSALYKIPEAHFLESDIANQSGDTEAALMEFRRGAKIITTTE